jgi:hypothetical protein
VPVRLRGKRVSGRVEVADDGTVLSRRFALAIAR